MPRKHISIWKYITQRTPYLRLFPLGTYPMFVLLIGNEIRVASTETRILASTITIAEFEIGVDRRNFVVQISRVRMNNQIHKMFEPI